MQSIACRIGKHNRIVVAVSEEIIPLQAAVGAEDGIRTEEPADVGVIVSGVQVVPSRFHVVVVPSVSERVDIGDVVRVAGHVVPVFVSDLEILPPSVVHILRDKRSRRVADAHNISLQVLVIPVFRSVVLHPDNRAGRVVDVVERSHDRIQLVVCAHLRQYPTAIYGVYVRVIRNHTRTARKMFFCPYSCTIVAERHLICICSFQRYKRQPSSFPVQIRCVFPLCRVPRSVIGDRCAVVVCQQIAPCAVRVTVGFAGFEFA